MRPYLYSLVSEAPPGFEFRAGLTRHEVRRGVFALFAPSPEAAEEAVGARIDKARGIIVCESELPGWSLRPSGLHQLDVLPGQRQHLAAIVQPALELLQRVQSLEDAEAERSLLLQRAEEDSARMVRDFNGYREGLLREIEERRSAEQALQRLNTELEQRVHKRTQELEETNAELLHSNRLLETAREEVELSLRETLRAKDAADAASRAKSDFLAMMSHEIRTPINGVMGMLTLLNDTALSPEQSDMAHTALESAEVLLGVLNDILDFSRIEARQLVFDREPFSLADVAQEVWRILSPAARRKGLAFRLSIDDEIPGPLVGDAGRIRQVLVNLVGNAIKFTASGEVHLHLKRGDRRSGSLSARADVPVVMTVEDTGIGIAEDKLPAIFERFTQADPGIARRFGGTGLGLAISRELVQGMGGTIGVTSRPGEGSSFWVRLKLPRAVPVEEPGDREAPMAVPLDTAAKGTDEPPPARALEVLVAEDNEINQRLAVHMLSKLGCHVETASDGAEALQALERQVYDLVFMDCQMPEMDGFEVTAALRLRELREDRHTVVIAMTAQAMKGDQEKCLRAGMDDYISKPVSQSALADLVKRWGPAPPTRSTAPHAPTARAQETEAASTPLLEGAVLEDMLFLMERADRDLLRGLGRLFHDESSRRLAAMRSAVEHSDGVALAREASQIRISCTQLGARRMDELCQRLQAIGLEGNPVDALPWLERLEHDADRTEVALEAFLTSRAGRGSTGS